MRPDKKWLYKYRMLIMVCLSILCTFTIEIFVYQWNVLNNPQQHLELSVEEQSIHVLETKELWQQLTEDRITSYNVCYTKLLRKRQERLV